MWVRVSRGGRRRCDSYWMLAVIQISVTTCVYILGVIEYMLRVQVSPYMCSGCAA